MVRVTLDTNLCNVFCTLLVVDDSDDNDNDFRYLMLATASFEDLIN